VTETLRKLKTPLTLGEYRLPAGVAVAPATVLAHYNPSTYENPELFRPERFIERSYSPFQYMPFGGGHRRCIGAAFASYETAIVLGSLLKRYQFELIDKAAVVPKRRNVTIGPSTAVPIRVVGAR
jgi:cytochrome P450